MAGRGPLGPARGLIEEGRDATSRATTWPAPTSARTSTLFGMAGFMAYAQEEILVPRRPRLRAAGGGSARAGATRGRPRRARRRVCAPAGRRARRVAPVRPVDPLHAAGHRPARGLPRRGLGVGRHEAIVPRSSPNPILHFAEVSAWLSAADQRAGGFAQHGASRVGPHYLRFLVRDGVDGEALLAAALGGCRPTRWPPGSLPRCEHTRRRAARRGGQHRLRPDRAGHAPGPRGAAAGPPAGARAGRQLSAQGAWRSACHPRDDRRPRRPPGGAAAGDRRAPELGSRADLLEIVMDLGRRPEARFTQARRCSSSAR